MNRPKLNSRQLWPAVYAIPDPNPAPANPNATGNLSTYSADRQLRSVPGAEASRARRPSGSYCLRRWSESMVTSVYLSRVLESIRNGLERDGEAFLVDLALAWISGDGSREVVLKGRALRRLVLGQL